MATATEQKPIYKLGEICRWSAGHEKPYRYVEIFLHGNQVGLAQQTIMLQEDEARKLVNIMSHS